MAKVYEGALIKEGIENLAHLMKESKNIVLLTGAGMDTESNIPDFRGKDGLWRKIDPRLVASGFDIKLLGKAKNILINLQDAISL